MVGHRLHAREEGLDVLVKQFQALGVDVSDGLGKRLLSEEGLEDMLGCDELMSVFLARGHRIIEHKVGIVAIL
jgi:hypothetical protein